jgi:predicted nucleic acid-binding protein
MKDSVFVDTWAWVAHGHRKDSRHKEVAQLFGKLRRKKSPLYTSDYVLSETLNLLFRRELFAEAVRFAEGLFEDAGRGSLVIERVTPARFAEAWRLRLRFRDKPDISFTDLTSMVIMEELGLVQVFTDDAHFTHVGMGFHKLP